MGIRPTPTRFLVDSTPFYKQDRLELDPITTGYRFGNVRPTYVRNPTKYFHSRFFFEHRGLSLSTNTSGIGR